jgi:hypothetical protein
MRKLNEYEIAKEPIQLARVTNPPAIAFMSIENICDRKSGDIMSPLLQTPKQMIIIEVTSQDRYFLTSDMITQGTGPIPTEYAA